MLRESFKELLKISYEEFQGYVCFFDDILVSGSNAKKHNDNLGEVLRRLQEAGLKLYILLSVQLVLIKFNTLVILLTLQVLNLLNRS